MHLLEENIQNNYFNVYTVFVQMQKEADMTVHMQK